MSIAVSAYQIVRLFFLADGKPAIGRVLRIGGPAHFQNGDLLFLVPIVEHDLAQIFDVAEAEKALPAIPRLRVGGEEVGIEIKVPRKGPDPVDSVIVVELEGEPAAARMSASGGG